MLQLERINELREAIQAALDGQQAELWTALPGIIESFDPQAVTAVVQPSIKAQIRAQDGSTQQVALPLLLDVPIVPMRGGGCTLTLPIAQGDECLVVFASRCIDGWWQAGGVQSQAEFRMHDLSDGFAFVGPFSQATKITGWSTSSAQLRSNDGSTFIDLNPTTQKITLCAPGGVQVTTPMATFSSQVTINGLLTWLGGMVGSAVAGVAATITGIINFVGQVSANGKRIDDTHTHNSVQPGSGNSGDVN